MSFFVKILDLMKTNCRQFALKTGVNQQMISWWLISDDCKYGNIVSTFEKNGIGVSCHYEPQADNKRVIKEQNISINIGDPGIPFDCDEEKKPYPILNQVLQSDNRLRFIAVLINDLGIGMKNFCQFTDIKPNTIYQWFRKDDVKISNIYDIAEKLHQTVVWDVKKNEKA